MTATLTMAPIWLACTGKDRFDSAVQAAMVAKRMNKRKRLRSKARTRPLSSYRCVHCGHFHVGGEGRI